MIAVGIGLLAAYVDSRPNFDYTGVLAIGILFACFVVGAIGLKHPWLYALSIGIWIPLHNIIANQNYGSLLALAFAFIGAYLGAWVGFTILKLKQPESNQPASPIAS